MKGFAKVLMVAGVLGGLLMGVQTLMAASPASADCWECWDMGGGRWICGPVPCDG